MKNNKRNRAIADLALIAVLVLAAAVIFLFQSGKEKGAMVCIRRNGDLLKSVDITQDFTYDLDGLLTVVVENGEVRVEKAVCGDKLCEHMGRISRSGESIVCLPNGITVEIVGEEFDFII